VEGTNAAANHIEGNLSAAGRSFVVVASRFNDFIVKALLDGALDAVRRHGGMRGPWTSCGCPAPTKYL
jgi:6,7-dimethyl-8-ribityllumazine synthase